MISCIRISLLFSLLALAKCQDILGPLPVSKENITLSGFSSGGTMAQMLQFAYSSLFRGVAVFSHTFYRCGPPNGDIDEYDRFCTTLFNLTESELWNTSQVHADIREYLSMNLIEDPANLKDKRLYVYSGLRNLLFTPSQSFKILQVYEPYIQNPTAIKTRVQDATQVLPSDTYGAPCNESAESTDFIANCGFSGVAEALNFLLDYHYPPTTANVTLSSNISTFDQTPFLTNLQDHQMDNVGYYYVPTQCQPNGIATPCLLHIYFHGCLTGHEFNGPRHVLNSGLLEYAEKNNLILLFPQARSTVANPIGCWDTFGVSGRLYATQMGPQLTAVKRMLDAVLMMDGELVMSPTTTTTTTVATVAEETTRQLPASSRLSAQRSNPPKGYPQKKPQIQLNRKLTYLPPPLVDMGAMQSLRRSGAYRTVKYAFLKKK